MLNWLSTKNKTQVAISPSIVVFTVAFLGFLYFLFMIKSILMLLFMSFILMVALNPAVNRFQKTFRLSRGVSILLTYVLFFLVIIALTALILPPLANEIARFIGEINLPYLQDQLNGMVQISSLEIGNLVTQFSSSINFLVGAVTSTFSGIFTFITLLIMSCYLMMDRPRLYQKISWFTGNAKHHKQAADFLDDLEEQLGGWVRAEVILMASIALMTYFGLSLLRVPFALPLAIIAGFLEILPNLGPLISAVPAVVFAYLTFGTNMGLMVAGLYLLIQGLENNLLVPRIMKVNAHVNPLVSITSILIGFQLAGVIGALMAIPVYIMLRAIFSFWRRASAQA